MGSLVKGEAAVHRWLRGIVFGLSASGIVAADQIAECCGMPTAVKWLKLASIACMLIGGMLTVDRPPNA